MFKILGQQNLAKLDVNCSLISKAKLDSEKDTSGSRSTLCSPVGQNLWAVIDPPSSLHPEILDKHSNLLNLVTVFGDSRIHMFVESLIHFGVGRLGLLSLKKRKIKRKSYNLMLTLQERGDGRLMGSGEKGAPICIPCVDWSHQATMLMCVFLTGSWGGILSHVTDDHVMMAQLLHLVMNMCCPY